MSLNLSKPAGIKLTILATDQLIAKMPKIEQLAENIMIILGIPMRRGDLSKHILKSKRSIMAESSKSRFKAIQQCHFLTDAEAEATSSQTITYSNANLGNKPSQSQEEAPVRGSLPELPS